MTLNEELAVWLASRPAWQKHTVSRLCRNETLSAEDVTEVVDRLIAGNYPAMPDVSAADIPGSTAAGEPVSLSGITGVRGVNALVADQDLTFGSPGLTIVFGNNASGKSGYARLIREAVTARVKSERLLGDIFAEVETAQAARLDYRQGSLEASWNLGEAQSSELARVRFFDEDCGEAYVTLASEVSYRPSALTILDQLSEACEAVSAKLASRLDANQSDGPTLPTLHPESSASRFLSGLSVDTSAEQIDSATALSVDHDEEHARLYAEEVRLKSSDPNRERARLLALARDWSTVATHAQLLVGALGELPTSALVKQKKACTDLREAARIASATSFDAELVPGVGSGSWRALWEAAREFSSRDAYHGHEFPVIGDGAVCVLCQQSLSSQAGDRLSRFEAFVTDTTSRDADEAERSLQRRKEALQEIQALPADVAAALGRLQASGEDPGAMNDWLQSASQVAQGAIAWLDGVERSEVRSVVDSVSAPANARSLAISTQASSIDDSTFAETLASISKQVIELRDLKSLSDARLMVEAEVARLVRRTRIEGARRLAATNSITTKRVELTEKYVTQEVRDRFTRETQKLDLRGVTFNRTGRGRVSALEHRASLLGSRREAGITEVLSEGEQTALGLAGFLTEVELDASLSSVVFDDPVSSLDAGRRAKVAQRLVELAVQRQIIVFTHEITFVHALIGCAKDSAVSVTARSIQRKGDTRPGFISDELPWVAKDVPQRIDRLEADISRLAREHAVLSEDEYRERTATVAGGISETLERAVNLYIVNQLVDRGANRVQPTMLKILPLFTQVDHDEYQAAYSKISSWAPRHDNAPEENYAPPSTEELRAVVAWLKGWSVRIGRYKN